jgi:hypothetical protein
MIGENQDWVSSVLRECRYHKFSSGCAFSAFGYMIVAGAPSLRCLLDFGNTITRFVRGSRARWDRSFPCKHCGTISEQVVADSFRSRIHSFFDPASANVKLTRRVWPWINAASTESSDCDSSEYADSFRTPSIANSPEILEEVVERETGRSTHRKQTEL